MACDMCGDEEDGYIVLIEGARMNVCAECAETGKILEEPSYEHEGDREQKFERRKRQSQFDITEELVDDYAERIVKARNRMGLQRAVVAEMTNEKESFLERIEKGKARPDTGLAKKLEKELGITLLEEVSAGEGHSAPKEKGGPVTLGDLIEVEKED